MLSVLLLIGLSVIAAGTISVDENLYLVNTMSNSKLLNETLDLLKEMKLEHGNTDNGISKSLEQAIRNLERLQGEDNSVVLSRVLHVLGKLMNNLPEIQELLDYLSEL